MSNNNDANSASKTKAFLRLVVVEHSIFALPFAFLAALTAMRDFGVRGGWFSYAPLSSETYEQVKGVPMTVSIDKIAGFIHPTIRWWDLLLVTIAMVSARTFAMAANRVIDRELDARNPRTATRELVTGVMAVSTAVWGSVIALAIFVATCAVLNPLCLILSPFAVLPLVVYPYAKRFTNYPQLFLGFAQMVAPVGAWIAVTGEWNARVVILGGAVGLWIGAFDLVYASQDVESDRAEGVGSVPAKHGIALALRAARVLHVVTFALFAWWGHEEHFGMLWIIGLVVTAAAFVYQHSIVSPTDLSRANRSFFTTNGVIAIALFVFGALDLFVHGGLRL